MRHAVLSRGWESSSFFSRQIDPQKRSGGALSLGLWVALGTGGRLGVSVATLGQVHHGHTARVAVESLPGHVHQQHAGVTSEAPQACVLRYTLTSI